MEDVSEGDAVFGAIQSDFLFQAIPVRLVIFAVDGAIERNQFGIMLAYGTRDLIAGCVFQVQVFEPVSIDPCASGFNDFPKIGYAGEDGGHEQDGFDPRNVELAQ